MRRRTLPHKLTTYTAAWAVVGGAFLWSINALADGIERQPQRAAAADDPPDYPELLGGEDAPERLELAVVAKPTPEPEQRDCITFDRALVLIGKIENHPVVDVDAFIRDLQRDLGDEEWCGGVRETIKIAFIPDPEDPPENPDPENPGDPNEPRDPGQPPGGGSPAGGGSPPGGGQPPGGGGGPGYASGRGI
ncbi:MAG: hypothetical protein GC206_03200 [Alphaproteobacteria bacterium]|nr:hypothetical protein [Alphaproteobacteria bacterium]